MKVNLKNSKWNIGVVKERENSEIRGTENLDKKRRGGARGETHLLAPKYINEGKPLVLLQVNCRSLYNKALHFWNLVDIHNSDIIIGTESWLREQIGNTEIFRTDYTIFRRDRKARGGGVFICVKNNITCSELWVDDDFEMLAVEITASDPK
jgi:hypothetical protein